MVVRLNAVSRARQNATAEDKKKKRGLSVESIYRYALIVSLHFRDYAIFAEEQNILTYGLCALKALFPFSDESFYDKYAQQICTSFN